MVKSQRAKNQTFPYSEAKRAAILARFKPGERVHATITRHGKEVFAAGKITRVAKTGWMYVKLDGRKSPTKVDPLKWQHGEGHPPKTAPAAPRPRARKAAPRTTTKKKKAPAKATTKKKAPAKAPRARKKAPARQLALAGGAAVEAPAVPAPPDVVPATPAKPKRVRNRKKKAPAPSNADSVAEHEAQGGGVAPEPPKRTPVHVEEPPAAGDGELN